MGFLLKGDDAKKYDELIQLGHTEHCAYDMVFFNESCKERCLFQPVRPPARTPAERAQRHRDTQAPKPIKPKGRPRKFQTNAQRQHAYRMRQKGLAEPLDTTTHTGPAGTKVLLECGPGRSDNDVAVKTT